MTSQPALVKIGNQTFTTSTDILSRSPYFEKALDAKWKQSEQGGKRVFEFQESDTSPFALEALLSYLENGTIPSCSLDDIRGVLSAAVYLQILRGVCETLLEAPQPFENLLCIFSTIQHDKECVDGFGRVCLLISQVRDDKLAMLSDEQVYYVLNSLPNDFKYKTEFGLAWESANGTDLTRDVGFAVQQEEFQLLDAAMRARLLVNWASQSSNIQFFTARFTDIVNGSLDALIPSFKDLVYPKLKTLDIALKRIAWGWLKQGNKGWRYQHRKILSSVFAEIHGEEAEMWVILEDMDPLKGKFINLEDESLEKPYEWNPVYQAFQSDFGKGYRQAVAGSKQVLVTVFNKLDAGEVYVTAKVPDSDTGKFFAIAVNDRLGRQGCFLSAVFDCKFIDDASGPRFKILDDEFNTEYYVHGEELFGDRNGSSLLQDYQVFELKGVL